MRAPTPDSGRFPVVLTGFMGVGKTTIGRALAELLSAPFSDADDEYERRFSETPASTIAGAGEAAFRRRELEVLLELVTPGRRAVIALGGGVVETPAARDHLREHCVIWLRAPLAHIASRPGFSDSRPLASDGAMVSRFARRQPLYREVATHAVAVDASATEIARRIAEVLADPN